MASLISGSMIIEIVFAWPGSGRLIIDSIRTGRLPDGAGRRRRDHRSGWPLVNVAGRCVVPPSSTHACGLARWASPAMTRAEATTDAAQLVQLGARRRRRHPLAGLAAPSPSTASSWATLHRDGHRGRPPSMAPHDPVLDDLRGGSSRPFWQSGGSWELPPGHGRAGAGHLQPADARGAPLTDRRRHHHPGAALVIGTLLGLFAGWRLGFAGRFLMRVVDLQLAFPRNPLRGPAGLPGTGPACAT